MKILQNHWKSSLLYLWAGTPFSQPLSRYCWTGRVWLHGPALSMPSTSLVTPFIEKLCSRQSLHTTAAAGGIALHDLAEALSHHPAIIAVTGGGGLGVMAGLYRSPAFWKLMANASADRSVLLLPQKPSHSFQSRRKELWELRTMFRTLRKQGGNSAAVAVYITGRPGFGKTQLARDFGKEYFRKNKGWLFRNLFVGTLNAASRPSFLQSYIALALELGCASELKALEGLAGARGEWQSLELLSAIVRKELKRRPGWLLVVDNLSTDLKSTGSPTPLASEVLPAGGSAIMPLYSSEVGRDSPSPFGVAAAYGIASPKAAWSSFWPQPGDESWGKGYVLVTSRDRSLVERSCLFARELFLNQGMSEADAVLLLEKVSGAKGEGAAELVNILDSVPLSVASAGFYIAAERTRNQDYSFSHYLSGLEEDIQAEGEKMLLQQNTSYPVTMTTAISMATRQLSSDSNLHKVFVLLAVCAQSPLPMRVVARVLGVRPDINSAALEAVRSCALLFLPRTMGDNIEMVSVYRGTREVFRKLLLGEGSELHTPKPHPSQPLLSHSLDCVVSEFQAARFSDSVASYRLRHVLLPHLEAFLQVSESLPGFRLDPLQEVELCHTLGSGQLLVGRPQRARVTLERALQACENSGGKGTVRAADIAASLGATYRHLGLLQESEFVLQEALAILNKECSPSSIAVAGVLNNLSATYKHRGMYQESRQCLERSLAIYEQTYNSRHPDVAHALTNLGATWRSLGDSLRSKELFEQALAIQEELFEPQHPAIAVTLGNLSMAFSDLGQPRRSVELLQRALAINQDVHGPEHPLVAITLSNLSVAHRHLGEVRTSQELAKEALRMTQALHGPAHPGVAIALGILGTTYCDLGELSKAQELLESSVEINKAINGPRHMGTAIAQTQLGRVARLAGNLQQARGILEAALETKQSIHGSEHPSVGMTLNSLGKVYHELGYLTHSIQALTRSRAIGQQLYLHSPQHPQIVFRDADLARVLKDCGEMDRSVELMQQALDLYTSTGQDSPGAGYTETHPKFASMLAVMGLLLRDQGRLQEASSHLERALRIQERILSEQSLMKAETICSLGTVLHQLGQHQRAMNSLDTAISMMKAVQHEHPVTATIMAAVSQLLWDMGDLHSAQLSMEEALKIQLLCCGEAHPTIGLYRQQLAHMLLHADSSTAAREQLLRALRVYQVVGEREGPLSEEAGLSLPVLQQWETTRQEIELKLEDLQ